MPDERRRERGGRRDRSFLRGTLLSAALHALAIVLILLAPHRMRAAPPTAYTVELVDPNALGGKLLAGPIGGGAAAKRAAPPPRAPEPPPPPPPPAPPPKPEPEQVAKAEPPEPAKPEPPKPEEDADAVPIGTATPVPQRTRVATPRPSATREAAPKASATPVAVVKPKPTASPVQRAQPKGTATPVVVAKATASPAALARAHAPSAAPTPSRAEAREAARNERDAHAATHDRGEPEGDLDSRLAAAIKGVESKVAKSGTPGLSGEGPGGGQGGTERTLNGPAGVGGEGPGGGGTLRGLEFVVYYNQMLTRIKESWTYVGERSDLRVTVRFSILDSGEITDIRLTERSGDAGYDASVERAVKRASPLGPPPAAYRKDFSDVELTFRPADLRRRSG